MQNQCRVTRKYRKDTEVHVFWSKGSAAQDNMRSVIMISNTNKPCRLHYITECRCILFIVNISDNINVTLYSTGIAQQVV